MIYFLISHNFSFALDPSNLESSEMIYTKLKEMYFKYTPKNFIADIESVAFDQDLKKIPKDVYCIPTKKLTLKYIFIQNSEELLIIENVENPFVNRFQMYIELYKTDKMILERSKSFQELLKKMIWEIHSITQNNYILKIQQYLNKKYYSLLYIDKQSFLIQKVDYYQNSKFLSSINIQYKKKDLLIFPEYLTIFLPKGKILDIRLKNYKINLKKNIDLLQLQDDCIDINKLFYEEEEISEDILNIDKKAS